MQTKKTRSLSRLQRDHMTGAGYIMQRAKNTAAERCMSVGFRARTGSQGFGSTGLVGDQEISRSEHRVYVCLYKYTGKALFHSFQKTQTLWKEGQGRPKLTYTICFLVQNTTSLICWRCSVTKRYIILFDSIYPPPLLCFCAFECLYFADGWEEIVEWAAASLRCCYIWEFGRGHCLTFTHTV